MIQSKNNIKQSYFIAAKRQNNLETFSGLVQVKNLDNFKAGIIVMAKVIRRNALLGTGHL
jgi:hypothetical protein